MSALPRKSSTAAIIGFGLVTQSMPYSIFAGLLIAFINRTRVTPKQIGRAFAEH